MPLPDLGDHPLCPVHAVQLLFSLTLDASPDGPAFMRGSQGCLTPVLYSLFMRKLKSVVALCGQEPEDFGTHSLRRGGASWALRCGYDSDVIRLLGDWKSDAYQASRYLGWINCLMSRVWLITYHCVSSRRVTEKKGFTLGFGGNLIRNHCVVVCSPQ